MKHQMQPIPLLWKRGRENRLIRLISLTIKHHQFFFFSCDHRTQYNWNDPYLLWKHTMTDEIIQCLILICCFFHSFYFVIIFFKIRSHRSLVYFLSPLFGMCAIYYCFELVFFFLIDHFFEKYTHVYLLLLQWKRTSLKTKMKSWD